MALVKEVNDCDLVITVADGVDKKGNLKKDVHRFSKIKIKAKDENIREIGEAILEVIDQSGEYTSIDKVEVSNLTFEK